MDSPRISELHAQLGTEENYRKFLDSYLNVVFKKDDISEQISYPILIDSIGMPNDIKTFLTAVNNHGGAINNELRITYVVDKQSKLPLFYRITVGNIIDNSLLISTIKMLASYGIAVEIVIMDAGYAAMGNISELISNNISFLTRMPENRIEFKRLIDEHGPTLKNPENGIMYGDRALFVKKVEITFESHKLYAYVMHDIERESHDEKIAIKKYHDVDDQVKKYNTALLYAGKFVLLSSEDYSKDEVLPMYYSRQTIEQVFDIKKNYAGGLPLRGHSENTIRGIILISFIATVIYSTLSHKLSNSGFSAISALVKMSTLRLDVYDQEQFMDYPTKDQKEIIKHLQLQCPFKIYSGNQGHNNNSFLSSLSSQTRGRGRPKGSKNKPKTDPSNFESQSVDIPRKRGRPKGSKNKLKVDKPNIQTPNSEVPRRRGRPKGSKNKLKRGNTIIQTPNSEA
jgi:hypothetical protein